MYGPDFNYFKSKIYTETTMIFVFSFKNLRTYVYYSYLFNPNNKASSDFDAIILKPLKIFVLILSILFRKQNLK